jgi:RNA polymerase sigma factor (sigma-70 family)
MHPKRTLATESESAFGQYLAEVERIAPLSAQEIQQLLARLPERAARDRLIEGHLPLVIQIARAYQGRGMHLSDLIQIGSLCLVEGIAAWTPETLPSLPLALLEMLRQAMEQALAAEARQSGNEEPGALRSQDGRSTGRRQCRRKTRGRSARRRRQTYLRARARLLPIEERLVREACAGCIAPLLRLSRRERDILSARTGQARLSYRHIAERLGISSRTARRHAARGLRKLRRARAVLCPLRRGPRA